MRQRMAKLYEVHFLDHDASQKELQPTFKHTVDILKEVRKTLLISAYALEDRRKLTNHLFKEHQKIHVQEDDVLFAYFAPELTRAEQTKIRSFYVRAVAYEKNKIILSVRLTYEKEKNWFDVTIF